MTQDHWTRLKVKNDKKYIFIKLMFYFILCDVLFFYFIISWD